MAKTTQTIADISKVVVPVGTIAAFLGSTKRYVQSLAKAGVIEKTARGQYPLQSTISAYVTFLREKGIGDDGIVDARRRLLQAKAALAEFEVGRLNESLLLASDVTTAWIAIVMRARQLFLAVPSRCAPLVAAETEAAVCFEIIQNLVYEALQELSETEFEAVENPEGN